MGDKRGRVFRNMIKDTWTKPKGIRISGGKWGWLGLGEWWGGKWRQLYLNNNFLKVLKKLKKKTPEYSLAILPC